MNVTDRRRHEFLATDIRRQIQQAAEEHKQRISLADIGRRLGVRQQAIQQALTGGTTWAMHGKISEAIEAILKARAAKK